MKLLVLLTLLASTAAALPLLLATGNVADLYSALGRLKERRTMATPEHRAVETPERRYLFPPEIFAERATAELERRDAETADPYGIVYYARTTEDPDIIVYHGRSTTTPERRNPMSNERAPPSIPYHGRATEDLGGIVMHGRATEKRMQNRKRGTEDTDVVIMHGRGAAPPWRRTTETPERDLEEEDTTGWAK